MYVLQLFWFQSFAMTSESIHKSLIRYLSTTGKKKKSEKRKKCFYRILFLCTRTFLNPLCLYLKTSQMMLSFIHNNIQYICGKHFVLYLFSLCFWHVLTSSQTDKHLQYFIHWHAHNHLDLFEVKTTPNILFVECSASFQISILMHSFIGIILRHTVSSFLCDWFLCGLQRKYKKGQTIGGVAVDSPGNILNRPAWRERGPWVCEHLKGVETDSMSHKIHAKCFFWLAYFKTLLGIIIFSLFTDSATCFPASLWLEITMS